MSELSYPTFQSWWVAARPRTLPAAAAPVFVAMAFAWRDGVFNWAIALACLSIALFMQIGANFANDLFDHERGSDTPDRLGPTRVTASGIISPGMMRLGIIIVFGFAVLLGLYLAWLRGWIVIALGVGILVAALAYTGGPFPYGYYALGDVFVFLSFGVAAVCGTYYVLSGSLPPVLGWASVPIGLLIVNILVVNNTRDISTDAAANKRTLAVYFGRQAMLTEYLVCIIGAYLVPLGLWTYGFTKIGVLLTWFSLPHAILLYCEFSKTEGGALNKTLAGTAQLSLEFALLLALGVAIFG